MRDAFQHAEKLSADLASRKSDLESTSEQVARLSQIAEQEASVPSSALPDELGKLLESVGGVRVSTADLPPGDLLVSFVEPACEGATLRLCFHQVGGKQVLRSASSAKGPAIPGLAELIAFAVSLDDAAFLVEETRLRLRCVALRNVEVEAIKQRHIVYDQNGILRITFPSGVMATLETGPDYPLGAGTVRVASIDTLGGFPDNVQSIRGLLDGCRTLADHVDKLAAKFASKKK